MSPRPLRHALLEARGIEHGFGVRGVAGPSDVRRPRQVHGAVVASAAQCVGDPPAQADAVVCAEPGVAVGVVTADCVPVLAASADGRLVAAIHAGWRGLANGVIEAAIGALRERGTVEAEFLAVIGPHVGACCYEVDAPVLEALASRRGLDAALRPSRAGHAMLDLGRLAREALHAAGLELHAVGALAGACTACDRERFHSYRRDGPRAGRLLHYIRRVD